MDNLEQLLIRYTKKRRGVHWVGARPDVRDGQMISAILKMIGYPTRDGFDPEDMIRLDCRDAADVLGYIATQSLAYGAGRQPSHSVQKSVLAAFRDLEDSAQFFSNGKWGLQSGGQSWCPLSQSTFDAGLLGFDSKYAFAFWVEEED